ncbi:hypothetical protein L8P27_05020 [Enterobacter asburiae]|uniref:hypothetical protein n=1 Tax=Enterobacter asburiae TaxID=61645 RepID=UPI002003C2FC|nr:hypothetical protein [Enterobacter asburiae]MCK7227213.1 hypothetical protein [Enterobacter asburiae]
MLSITSSGLTPATAAPARSSEPATTVVLDYSKWVITHLKKLPGISADAGPEKIETHRAALLNCLSELKATGRMTSEGEDAAIRPVVVGMQAIIEHTLLAQLDKGLIAKVEMIFTTKKPPTPLSAEQGVLSDRLATPAVLNSSGCVDTITSRQNLLHKMIKYPQVEMSSFYAQKHPDNEQHVFDKFCDDNKGNFHSCHVESMPDELSGATYEITPCDGDKQLFGIRFTQASEASSKSTLFTDINCEGEIELLFGWIAKQHPTS